MDTTSKSAREVALALFGELAFGDDVSPAAKKHYLQAVSKVILSRRKPSEAAIRSVAPPPAGRSGLAEEEERRKADNDQMAVDMGRAKINCGSAPQLAMRFSSKLFNDIRRGILLRGVLIREVAGLKGVGQTDLRDVDKKEVPLGTSEFSIISNPEASGSVDLTKSVNVIRAAYMMLLNILCICCLPTGSSGLGSEGAGGNIVDAQGNVEHWHMTPDNFSKIFEWVLEVNSLCSASTFMTLWAAACRRASDLMQNNFCVGHALVHVVQVEFNPRLICGGAPLRLPSEKVVADGIPDTKEPKELLKLQRELKAAKQELDQVRQSHKRLRDQQEPIKRREVCRDFQKDSACSRGRGCRFAHECERCGSKEHGSMSQDCPRRRH